MELLTVNETAKLLRVSPITVRRRIADGQLKAVRVGKGIRVPREAIEQFMTPVRGYGSEGSADRAIGDVVGQYTVRTNRTSEGGRRYGHGYFMSDLYELGPDGKLTPESRENAARVIEEARKERQRDLEKRGGIPWPNSWELINEGREERTRQLMGDEERPD